MTVAKTAAGVALGLLGAGVLTRLIDDASEGREHGVHIALAMLVPLGGLALSGGLESGSVARGAMYGVAAGGALTATFVSTFSFTNEIPGFFGKESLLALDPPRTPLQPPPSFLARKDGV